jgi:hypothetical protein
MHCCRRQRSCRGWRLAVLRVVMLSRGHVGRGESTGRNRGERALLTRLATAGGEPAATAGSGACVGGQLYNSWCCNSPRRRVQIFANTTSESLSTKGLCTPTLLPSLMLSATPSNTLTVPLVTYTTRHISTQWPATRSRTFPLVCSPQSRLDSYDHHPSSAHTQPTPPPPPTTFNLLSHPARSVSNTLVATPSMSGHPLVVGTRNPRTGKQTLPSWASRSSSLPVSSSA